MQEKKELPGRDALDLSRVRFEPIDAQALSACSRWDDPHFSWHDVVEWKAKEPMALDLSIWFEEQLCGLCFANPNKSRQRIRIVRLEGRPGKVHLLKRRIATLSILAIEHYAVILGSRFIEVQEPLTGAIPIYQQHGFYFDTERRLVKAVGSQVS